MHLIKREGTHIIHLNGNALCVIDVETTGLDPEKHEIVEVCFLPLDAKLEPRTDVVPFDLKIKPEKIDNIDWEAFKVTKINFFKLVESGLDKYDAADLFEQWVEQLKLPDRKRISPLAHNWKFDNAFIRQWLSAPTSELYIDGRSRDTMEVALYINDRADHRSEQIPFPKVNLGYLASCLKIPHKGAHSALGDCITTAEVYKEMLKLTT